MPLDTLQEFDTQIFEVVGKSLIFILGKPNALLRGEQRNTKAAAYHLKHKNQRIVKMTLVANPS